MPDRWKPSESNIILEYKLHPQIGPICVIREMVENAWDNLSPDFKIFLETAAQDQCLYFTQIKGLLIVEYPGEMYHVFGIPEYISKIHEIVDANDGQLV